MQLILVIIILAACVAYTARRLWKRFTAKREDDVRCAGCPLADSCQHKMTASDCCCGSGHECNQH